jgi:aryl sulfotransferase
MRRIAEFLGEEINEATFAQAVQKCEFAHMKASGEKFAPAGGALWNPPSSDQKASSSFFNKGENDRWKGVLSVKQLAAYEEAVKQKLEPECAHWLATGELPGAAAK